MKSTYSAMLIGGMALAGLHAQALAEPEITSTEGSGTYPIGTQDIALIIRTATPAECRLASSPGHPFGALYLDFANEGNQVHQYQVSPYGPGEHRYYAKCRDLETQAETDDIVFNITLGDESPPQISYVSGLGPHARGTEAVALTIATDVNAQCRFSLNGGIPYTQLTEDFSSDDQREHRYTVTTDGRSDQTYYARCVSLANDIANDTDTPLPVTYSADDPGAGEPQITLQSQLYYEEPQDSVTLMLGTQAPADCRISYSGAYPYDAMYLAFSSTDGYTHTHELSTYGGGEQTVYVSCLDWETQQSTADPLAFTIVTPTGTGNAIEVLSETDFNAPQESVVLTLGTSTPADCRISYSGAYPYGAMYTDFTSTDGYTHTHEINTYGGGEYTVYVACLDRHTQTATTDPLPITITVPTGSDVGDDPDPGDDNPTDPGNDDPQPGGVEYMQNTEYETPYTDTAAAVAITESPSHFLIKTDNMDFEVDKHRLNLVALKSGERIVRSMASSLKLNDEAIRIGKPESFSHGDNWVEVRGWYSAADNLWYVARFRFWPDQPFVHLAFSLTDRHDDHPTEAHWDGRWEQREIENFRLFFRTETSLDYHNVGQLNAFSGGEYRIDPKIVERTAEGETHWRQEARADGTVQLFHWADNSGGTYLRIRPYQSGTFSLSLKQRPLASPYPAANAVEVIVKHVNGRDKITVDQGLAENALGSFILDEKSFVRISAKGEEGDRIVFETLELTRENGEKSVVQASRVPDHVLDTNGMGVVVKDFWKKFPISLTSKNRNIVLTGIKDPVQLAGGAGYTVDVGLNFDTDTAASQTLADLMNAPPAPSFPEWWHALDGVESHNTAYRNLINKSHAIINTNDAVSGNYGWMNWGDYQISGSYFTDGEPTENWGALQYDLGHGLLMAWMHTGDDYLWNRARASVRSSMDVQIAKFEPYLQKSSGAGLRKGECTVNFHWCQENIPEFNYHTRSLLLYAHLTGEQWPKDIAQMVIDNSAYFAHTRTDWLINDGSRPLGWALRNLYYGARLFPEGTHYSESQEYGYAQMPAGMSYTTLLNNLVETLVAHVERTGLLPGDQPVWQGQILEGLMIAIDGELLSEELQDRALKVIAISLAYFDDNYLRQRDNGDFEMAYDTSSNDWADAATYGWFWVNSYAWAGQHIDDEYGERANELLSWLYRTYQHDDYHTTRAWSGVMGFPSYATSLQTAE